MSKLLAVVNEDLGMGFNLAGIPTIKGENSWQRLKLAIDSHEFGMIIVEQELLDGLDPSLRRDLLRGTKPLIVPIPGRLAWTDVEEPSRDDLVARLIRQAVGYQLNIRL